MLPLLLGRLCGQWNVMGVDLMNEPHAASWGKGMGDGSDWGHAAERIGNHVLSQVRACIASDLNMCLSQSMSRVSLHLAISISPNACNSASAG